MNSNTENALCKTMSLIHIIILAVPGTMLTLLLGPNPHHRSKK